MIRPSQVTSSRPFSPRSPAPPRGDRDRTADAAGLRAHAPRRDPRGGLHRGEALGEPGRRLGSRRPVFDVGRPGGHRRRPPLPRDHELGRGPGRVVGRLRRLEGRARRLGRRRCGRHGGRDRRPTRPAPTSRCSPTASPRDPARPGHRRFGNYFNQELFGTPTTLPWALEIDPENRPDGYGSPRRSIRRSSTSSSGNRRRAPGSGSCSPALKPGGVFFLYVMWYSLARFSWEEQLRIDPSHEVFGTAPQLLDRARPLPRRRRGLRLDAVGPEGPTSRSASARPASIARVAVPPFASSSSISTPSRARSTCS